MSGLTLTPERLKKLEKLAAETPCGKNHECLRSQFRNIANVEVVAHGRALICRSESGWQCQYATAFGHVLVCTCPVRKYIANHLHG